MNELSFMDIPEDIIIYLSEMLDPKSFYNFRLSCRSISNRTMYPLYKKKFGYRSKIYIAIATGKIKNFEFLIQSGEVYNNNFVDVAARHDDKGMLEYLLQKGYKGTSNAVDWASMNNHLEMVKYLHSLGIRGTQFGVDLACKKGHLKMVRFLIEECNDILESVRKKHSKIEYANEENREEAIRWAIINIKYDSSMHAIDHVAEKGHLHILQYLYKNGKRSVDPEYTKYLARKNEQLKVLQFLESFHPN